MLESPLSKNHALPIAVTAMALGVAATEGAAVAQPNPVASPNMASRAIQAGSFNSQPGTPVNADATAQDVPAQITETVITGEAHMNKSPQYSASANAHVLSQGATEEVKQFVHDVTEQAKTAKLVSLRIAGSGSDDAANKENGGAARENVENEKLGLTRAKTVARTEKQELKKAGMENVIDISGDEKIRKTIAHELAKLGKKEGKSVQEIIAGGGQNPAERKILAKYEKDRGAKMKATFIEETHQPPAEQLAPPYVGHEDVQPTVHHDNPMMLPDELQPVPVRGANDAQYKGSALRHQTDAKAPETILKAPRSHNMHDKGKASRKREDSRRGRSHQRPLSRSGR